MNTSKRIEEALDWQTLLMIRAGIEQDIAGTKKIHITEEMLNDAREQAKSLIMDLILEEKKKSYIAGGIEEILHRDEAREAVIEQLQKGKS